MEERQLTLEIISPKDLKMEPIKFNFEDLKMAIANTAQIYKSMVYTEETMQVAKKDLATLRKFRTAIEDKRKEVKKICLAPYEDFETKVKELVYLIDEPISLIDSQVKDYDQARVEAKARKALDYFQETVSELNLQEVITWDIFKSSDYEKLSLSDKKVQEDIDERLSKIQADWEVISTQASPYEFEIKQSYRQSLDLADALAVGQHLAKQAEEKAAFEEAEAKRRAEREAARQAEIAEKIASVGGSLPAETKEAVTEIEPTYTVRFQVTGTEEQLKDLSQYAKSIGLAFVKI